MSTTFTTQNIVPLGHSSAVTGERIPRDAPPPPPPPPADAAPTPNPVGNSLGRQGAEGGRRRRGKKSRKPKRASRMTRKGRGGGLEVPAHALARDVKKSYQSLLAQITETVNVEKRNNPDESNGLVTINFKKEDAYEVLEYLEPKLTEATKNKNSFKSALSAAKNVINPDRASSSELVRRMLSSLGKYGTYSTGLITLNLIKNKLEAIEPLIRIEEGEEPLTEEQWEERIKRVNSIKDPEEPPKPLPTPLFDLATSTPPPPRSSGTNYMNILSGGSHRHTRTKRSKGRRYTRRRVAQLRGGEGFLENFKGKAQALKAKAEGFKTAVANKVTEFGDTVGDLREKVVQANKESTHELNEEFANADSEKLLTRFREYFEPGGEFDTLKKTNPQPDTPVALEMTFRGLKYYTPEAWELMINKLKAGVNEAAKDAGVTEDVAEQQKSLDIVGKSTRRGDKVVYYDLSNVESAIKSLDSVRVRRHFARQEEAWQRAQAERAAYAAAPPAPAATSSTPSNAYGKATVASELTGFGFFGGRRNRTKRSKSKRHTRRR